MSSHRIKIRCPNCGKDGVARPELLGRRVACKHCHHIFRTVAIDDPAAALSAATKVLVDGAAGPPAEPSRPSKDRIESLEREVRQLREDLSAERIEVARLQPARDELDKARAEAEARQAEEARGFRDELARSRAELDEAREANVGLRLDRDRLIQELETLRALQAGPEVSGDLTYPSTEAEVPALEPGESIVFDGNPDAPASPKGNEAERLDPAEAEPTPTPADGGTWTAWPRS